MIDYARAIPILASLNLDESARFYGDKLGFTTEVYGDYMIARRDEIEFHFWLATDRIHPEHTACYIRGGQIPALYADFQTRNISDFPVGSPRLSDFAVRPWNMKEFYIWDPHGNLLKFGMAPQEAEDAKSHDDKLPDMLRDHLRLVFVGTAAGHRSVAERAYYAHPGNRFWRTLHEVGLTPECYKPQQFVDLLELGIGFTDMSKVGAGMDHEVAEHEFDVARFRATMRQHRPRVIAFTSKKAASIFYGVPTKQLKLGLQPPTPDFPTVFILASPSGAAASHWDITPWQQLAAHLK